MSTETLMRSMATETVNRTLSIGLETDQGSQPASLVYRVLREAVTAVSIAVQRLLQQLSVTMRVQRDDTDALAAVDLFLPLTTEMEVRARSLIAKPRGVAKTDRGPKEAARPQYRNSYRMEEIINSDGVLHVRCRVAEAFTWQALGGAHKGQYQRAVDKIDSTIGLQGLLKSWVTIPWGAVPSSLRAGACQQAAQQFNSHVGLLASGLKASFPSLLDRDPVERERVWREALKRLVRGTHAFEYAKAREAHPGKYAPGDSRGDRLVNVDTDWLEFVFSPFPTRQALNLVKNDDVVIYTHEATGRLYAALPLFTGVDAESALGQLSCAEEVRWWRPVASQFTALPAWNGATLSPRRNLLVVPVQTRDPLRLTTMLSSQAAEHSDGRRMNWSLITEGHGTRDRNRNQRQWTLHLATSRQVVPVIRPNVLGIHFGMEPILWWVVLDRSGSVLDQGVLQDNEILTTGLAKQLHLYEEQGKQRWVGRKRFAGELKRRTHDVACRIISLAVQFDANLSIESINWVDKQRGGALANRRHSLWNFS